MVSYSKPRSLPCASPLPLLMEMAIIAGTRFWAIRLSNAANNSGSGPSAPTMNGAARAGDVLLGNIHGDAARVGRGMAGGHDQLGGIVGIGRAEGAGLARDAGIKFAVRRIHREVVDGSLRHAFLDGHLRRGIVGWADDEVSIGVRGSVGAVGQFLRGDITGSVRIARRRRRTCRARRSLRHCRAEARHQRRSEKTMLRRRNIGNVLSCWSRRFYLKQRQAVGRSYLAAKERAIEAMAVPACEIHWS